MIKRTSEKVILERALQFPVVGIVGPRQVGKTTLAKLVATSLQYESIYLDLELPSHAARLREAELYLREYHEKTIIIDEVQRMPELFPLLRSLIDEDRRPGRFVLLGSASPALLQKSAESLAGRISYIELHPLSLEEVGADSFKKLWLRGGFPESFLAPSDKMAAQWLTDFIRNYAERDLPMLGLNTSPALVRQLLLMLASLHGNLLNHSLLSKSLGISSNAVKNCIDFLESAFIVRQLPAWHLNIKKRVVKSPKLFLRDSGVLHQLLGVETPDDLYGHHLLGSSWEGFVIQQIISATEGRYDPYFYRTQDQSELDLLLVKGNKVEVAIEIKYSDSPTLSKGNTLAFEDANARLNLVVTPSAEDYPLKNNIRVCSISTFNNYL